MLNIILHCVKRVLSLIYQYTAQSVCSQTHALSPQLKSDLLGALIQKLAYLAMLFFLHLPLIVSLKNRQYRQIKEQTLMMMLSVNRT